jgi:alpha-tubulin suppressor-like RCC1 family protein
MAIKTNGTLWGWGGNLNSGLGDGTDLKRVSPVQIGSATDWQSVAVGGYFGIGLKADGAFWGWGDNSSGQLGDTLETISTTPRLINP